MKTLIINLLNEKVSTESIDIKLKNIKNVIQMENDTIDIVDLRNDDLKHCIGCWSCWVKTPGICVHKDEIEQTYKKYINSDRVVFLLGTHNGFINNISKKFIDRLIPHYHPYIIIEDSECHHRARYDKYPEMIFYIDPQDLSIEEKNVIEDYCYRTAYHFRSNSRIIDLDRKKCNVLKYRAAKNELISSQPLNSPKKIIIYNGSPRRAKSNTSILISHIVKGIKEAGIQEVTIRNLFEIDKHETYANEFKEYDNHLFIMPLYVHAMPSIVMRFIEKLTSSINPNHSIAFIIQSGFPESSQSYYLRAYFGLLAKRLRLNYAGTVIKGGVEGIQIKPKSANNKLFNQFRQLGYNYAKTGTFEPVLIEKLAKPKNLGIMTQKLFNAFSWVGLVNFYWDKQLKKNKAFDKRFDKPYI